GPGADPRRAGRARARARRRRRAPRRGPAVRPEAHRRHHQRGRAGGGPGAGSAGRQAEGAGDADGPRPPLSYHRAVRLRILYFAAARERAGCAEEALELPAAATVRDALAELARRHPALERLVPHLRVAVDQAFAAPDAPLSDGAELA